VALQQPHESSMLRSTVCRAPPARHPTCSQGQTGAVRDARLFRPKALTVCSRGVEEARRRHPRLTGTPIPLFFLFQQPVGLLVMGDHERHVDPFGVWRAVGVLSGGRARRLA